MDVQVISPPGLTTFQFNQKNSAWAVKFDSALLPAMLVVVNSIMALQLEQHQYGEVTVLRFISKCFEGEADSAYLLIIIDQLLGIDKKHILLNLKELTEIDDTALGALVEAHSKVKAADGVIKIVNAAQRHADLLILSRLALLSPSLHNEEEGIRSFAPEAGHFDILEFVREMNEEEQGQQVDADRKQ